MQTFSKAALIAFLAVSSLSINQADAFCARCQKIESDREKEQAAHPKAAGYYDDEISLATEESTGLPSTTLTPKESAAGSVDRSALGAPASKAPAAQNAHGMKKPETANGYNFTSPKQSIPSSSAQNNLNEKGASSRAAEGLPSLPKESTFNVSQQPAKPRNAQTYSTIETILLSKDLLTTLGGSFTLFIPSDEAFRHLPQGTLHELFRPENKEQLSALVGGYIVPTKIVHKDIKNVQVSTLSGKNLDIRVQNETLTVNGVRAIHFEPVGDNGIIYILETVLPSPSAVSTSAQ